jgi:hypothetical protein
VYSLETSEVRSEITNREVSHPPEGATPVFIFDTDINPNHQTLDGAVVDELHKEGVLESHGTAVASLAVCGAVLSAGGEIVQDNNVISVNVSQDDFSRIEEIIEGVVEEYSKIYPIIIANLSANSQNIVYDRKNSVDKLTVLLDDLANKYNCIFVISAGNLFNDNWYQVLEDRCHHLGYPNYFKENFTRINPPADSINNITVGSITYQQSSDSLVELKSPTVHTRGNLDGFVFIKPDLVHFDTNYKRDFTSEDNGVLMAHTDTSTLTSIPGTSFSAPLVAHDLMVLHTEYPTLTANSLKGLILHFADREVGQGITSKKIREKLIGFGLPDIEKAIHSHNHSSTLIIEDEITVGKEKEGREKIIRFPVPHCLSGDARKRLRINKTLVYNPPVNTANLKSYNPISLSVQLIKPNNVNEAGRNTADIYGGAHQKSNVQKYPSIEKSTKEHTGEFWSLKVIVQNRDEKCIDENYQQKYSVIISVEDIKEVEGIDLHEEVINMIEVETHIDVTQEVTIDI